MAWAPVAIMAAATTVMAIGQIRQGNATSAADLYQGQVARNNATIAEQNATYAEQAGQIKGQDIQQRGRVAVGRIKAQQAASGLDVNSGSAPLVRASQAVATQTDVARTAHEARLQAYGYRSQARGYEAQSKLDTMSASAAKTAGYFAAGGTLLGAASSLGGKWGSQSAGFSGLEGQGLYDIDAGGAGGSNYAPG